MKCPKCGGESVSTTLMGFSGLDTNEVGCRCGNHGVAWQWQERDEIIKGLHSSMRRGLISSERVETLISKVDGHTKEFIGGR